MFNICKLHQKQFRIQYTKEQEAFIARMPELEGKEWDNDRNLSYPPWIWGDGVTINDLKAHISKELNDKQDPFCAYCGMRLELTSNDQVEHIAPKGKKRYPQFMFKESNLILACSLCNGFEKKEKKGNFKTTSKIDVEYENCKFNIVHPYFDKPEEHLDLGDPQNKRITISSKTLKGQKTIAVFKLDEEPQTNGRWHHLIEYIYDLDQSFRDKFEDCKNKK